MDELILRAIAPDDAPGFYRLCSRERDRIGNYFPITTERTIDQSTTNGYVKDLVEQSLKRELYCFLVFVPDGPDPIGAVFLKAFDWRVPKCELAYFVAADHQGQGIATAAVAWAVDEAYRKLGMERVFLRADPQNTASIRVAEKNGFEREGLLRRDFRTKDGNLVDVVYFGKLR